MRKITLYITILCAFLSLIGAHAVYADTTVAYIGSDLDQSGTIQIQQELGSQNTKYMSISAINALLSTSLQGPVVDGVIIANDPTLHVSFVKNDDTTIDPLGYASYLISLGIFSGNVKVVNHVTEFSLAESLQAYTDLGNNPDTHFVSVYKEEQKIYQELLQDNFTATQIGSLFFNIQKAALAIPETKSDTVAAVNISIAREKLTLTASRKNELYTWAYDYVNTGNTATGFFRDINLTTNTNGDITIASRALFNAPNKTSVSSGQKLSIFLTFLFLVLVGIYFLYRSKQKKNITSTTSS